LGVLSPVLLRRDLADSPGALEVRDQGLDLGAAVPRMGGRELAERLLTSRPDLAVIFMSGYAGDFRPSSIGDDRTTVCLQKPFAPDLLLRRIRELLRRRGGGRRPDARAAVAASWRDTTAMRSGDK
jgi:DNA-binding response OmpR family regulator